MELIRPTLLHRGGTIGVISPASSPNATALSKGVKLLESKGFRVELGPVSKKLHGGGMLSAPDEDRAKEISWAFSDAGIDAIISSGGGYGTMRVLDSLDFGEISEHPKIIVGYSDLTALLNSITKLTGLITFHGPMVASDFGEDRASGYSISELLHAITLPSPLGLVPIPEEAPPVVTVLEGKAQGRLAGGNLTLITRLMGTKYQIDFADKIALIEDVGEDPYRIDGMLTQLLMSGCLEKCNGIVFSTCVGCPPEERLGRTINRITVESVVKERLEKLGKPAIYNFPAGHTLHKPTLPLGAACELDATSRTLRITEPAVKS
jgi:muramoyltetrapeptide carboxypeptidase